ncbi:MAG: hypothetical protein QM305_11665 [Bacteroidota bacterium]|nr:hypothetical protein [Bacteroidota bacterium]
MRKTTHILLIILSLLSLLQCKPKGKALNKQLNRMALEVNESAPVMLNSFIRLEGASVSSDNVFQYRYTVLNTDNPDSMVQSGLPLLRETIRNEYKSKPQLRVFKENNVVVEYMFMSEENRVIHSLRMNPEEYK